MAAYIFVERNMLCLLENFWMCIIDKLSAMTCVEIFYRHISIFYYDKICGHSCLWASTALEEDGSGNWKKKTSEKKVLSKYLWKGVNLLGLKWFTHLFGIVLVSNYPCPLTMKTITGLYGSLLRRIFFWLFHVLNIL